MERDERGRPIASDGWPLSGMARVDEVVRASGLSRSKVYNMLRAGDLQSATFGKSRRVPWAEVRRLFLCAERFVFAQSDDASAATQADRGRTA